MSKSFPKASRILTIDPTVKGYAYAILEGPDALIEWGTAQVAPKHKNLACLHSIEQKIIRYQPDVLVLEDCRGKHSRRRERVERLLRDASLLGERHGLRRLRVSRSRVEAVFGNGGRINKQKIAEAIAERFPVLKTKLPRVRKIYMSEDERMSIFDALSFALALVKPKAEKNPPVEIAA